MPPQKNMFVLLPPSEGKAEGGTPRTKWSPSQGTFGKALGPTRRLIAATLAAQDGGSAALLGVSGKHLERAQAANSCLAGSATLSACERYTGVVWDHMSPSTMSAKVHARAAESIIVLSGLLGLVGFDDQIPDYKLKMGASFAPIGKLSTWWREPLSKALNARLAGHHVIDLLPNEHRAAWTPTPDAYASLSSVTFVEKSGKVAGHDAKAAKGLLARHVLESTGSPLDALTSWEHPRFTLTY